jgi:alpha-mannosidase
MLPQHHLLALVPNRVNAAINRLQGGIWTDFRPLKVEATAAGPAQLSWKAAMKLPRRPVKDETFWGRLFDQRWCRIVLPNWTAPAYLNWKDQGEATLYLDGKPYYGFDVAHRFCRLPAGRKEAWIESNCVQSAIWHPEVEGMDRSGSYFSGAALCRRDEEAWHGYHDLKCLFDTALDLRTRDNPALTTQLNAWGVQPSTHKASPVYRQLLRALDEAVDAYDSQGIPAMRKKLAAAYRYFRKDKSWVTCVLTGHAHVDLVWLWPERIGELKAVHSFATMNRLMEDYPEFRFAYSQPASYEAVKKRSPELYREVVRRIRSGKWQATGAMYVESDTLLACGEALGRSFTLGQKAFRAINERAAKLNWLPDVFGYSACLPQLMKLTGVDYFFTTKMTWNVITRFPHSSFIWKGNDGSEVLAHVTQESGYVTHMRVQDVKAPMYGHQQADVHPEYLLPTGYGDGGGGPTDEMCEAARRLDALPGMPAIAWDQPEQFFERLDKIRDRLPTHQGECYLEFHRGTLTSHGELKAIFRRLERALQVAEAAAAATGKRWDMEHAWKRLVFAQFHDYIPGSSVWDVYQEGWPELRQLADEQLAKSQGALGKTGTRWCVFNPHALPVQRRVRDPKTKKDVLVALPPFSGSELESVTVREGFAPVAVSAGRKVSNGLVEFEVNGDGWIKALVWEGQTVPLRDPLGQLGVYPDRPSNFEVWEIDRHTLSLAEIGKEAAAIKPWKDGDLCRGIEVTRKLGKESRARVIYALEAGSPLVHITVELDWKEPEYLLKMHFPTAFAATNARFGAPFGSVLRPQVILDQASEAKWEVPLSRYLAVFDEGESEGLFLVTESKYGATVRDGTIGLSLVRSPRVPGFESHARAWPSHLTRLKVSSPYADIGKHVIRLALGRYANDLPRERQPAAVAETLFTEPVVYSGAALAPVLEAIEGGETLVPAWIMPLEGKAWLLRLHEAGGRRGSVRVRLAKGWKAELSDFEGGGDLKAVTSRGIAYTPYQIVTVRVSGK